ncbi:hypothetical protein BDB00DRAFT_775101 [Zychaea mexicana]|uniref:uncharacterized protein n=1 Tax=Zychaea mexicana TaxID=64656 RepID=UPI0022FEA971|nr:uncharacterized protein BDB00DRAFT_775101 [Zychaea mexicana]KAI9484344.1 hypothetical protein BDB00DRAFT_775101 [Zychaea mexicana]
MKSIFIRIYSISFLLDNVAESIAELLPKHQAYIHNLKSNGFTVVGYARKSPGTEDIATRLQLLQKMVGRLFKVSLTDKAFVSYSTKAADSISSRDSHTEKKTYIANAQHLIDFIRGTDTICLVFIDYAGFSINPSDILAFIK